MLAGEMVASITVRELPPRFSWITVKEENRVQVKIQRVRKCALAGTMLMYGVHLGRNSLQSAQSAADV